MSSEQIVDDLIADARGRGERVIAVQFPPGESDRLYKGFEVREGNPGIVIDGRPRG